jgi:hypothetical protein
MSNVFKVGQPWLTMSMTLSIAICDMQLEDTEARCILWRKQNAIVMNKGVRNPNFKGFVVDITQANGNDVCIVYGTGDPIMKLIDKERTYFFH